jgi:hypothetical protein
MSSRKSARLRAPSESLLRALVWLPAGGVATTGLFTAVYLGRANVLTVCLVLASAASVLCIKADSDMLKLWRLFALMYFCVLPICQLIARDEIYLTLLPEQNDATVLWFVLNIIGLWAMNLTLIGMRSRRPRVAAGLRPERNVTMNRQAYVFALFAFGALALIYLKLGGYGRIAQLYADRLETSVTQNDPLEGLGVIQALANTSPLWIFVCVMLRPWRGRLMRTLALVQLVVLGWLSSGVFGNRRGMVFVILFACLIYHAFVRRISQRVARLVGIGVAVGGLAMIPLKFGIDFSDLNDVSRKFAEQRMLQLSMGPVSFFLFRDLSRFDVQVLALDTEQHPGYTLAMGRSFAGAVAAIVPKAIWESKPETFAKEKSSIVRKTETNQSDSTTLLFGMPGEFLVNFGISGYILSFVILGWLIARIQQLGEGAGWRWLPVRIVCYPLPFLFLFFSTRTSSHTTSCGGSSFLLCP